MDEEVVIKCESRHDEDTVEKVLSLWKGNLDMISERKLRQYAETLVHDISKYQFDFSSDSVKYSDYAGRFQQIMKSISFSKDETINVDVYWIQQQLFKALSLDDDFGTYEKYFYYKLILDTSTESAGERRPSDDVKKIRDAGLIEDVLTREYLAARHVMNHLSGVKNEFVLLLNDAKFKNVRCFMDSALKHKHVVIDECDDFVVSFEDLKLHKCILENQIFLLDFLLTNVLNRLEPKALKIIFQAKDENGCNIFHLACEKRIKFLVDELSVLLQKTFEGDEKLIHRYLLQRNNNDKNLFMLAFQMPYVYSNWDYANEIKNRTSLLNYYRDPGPLEIEIYNFESALNSVFNIGRSCIPEKYRKGLIVTQKQNQSRSNDFYDYSKEFQDFRYDFLSLRTYLIVKLDRLNPKNIENLVYIFLSGYIEHWISTNYNDESSIIALFQNLSFNTFLTDFFRLFVLNNFTNVITKINTHESLQELINISIKVLSKNDYHKIMTQSLNDGNNALQYQITSGKVDMFRVLWSSFHYNKKVIAEWILSRNMFGENSLTLAVSTQQTNMLEIIFEYFAVALEEEEIFDIFVRSSHGKHKFIDHLITHYHPDVFNLTINFIRNHLSCENQKALISDIIILLSVRKSQESAIVNVLNLIESLYDEDEIREILFHTNWEGQTAYHMATKNHNLTFLQILCKFARYYLNKEDFLKLLKAKDQNEYSIICHEMQHADEILYNELPKVSNFNTSYPVYEWVPCYANDFPNNAYCTQIDSFGSQEVFIAKICDKNDGRIPEITAVTKDTKFDFDNELIDILVARGLKWGSRSSENLVPLEVEWQESSLIARTNDKIKLINIHSNEDCDILCLNNCNLLMIDSFDGFIFQRVN